MNILITIASVHKIKRLTRPQFDKLSESDKKAYLKEFPESTYKSEKVSLNNIKLDMNTEVTALVKHFNLKRSEIDAAMQNKNVVSALRHGTVALAEAANHVLKFANTTARSAFEEIAKTNAIKRLQKGTMKVDDFLNKYPTIKKMTGPLIAGALTYQWVHMAFSGDFDDDFDITSIGEAMQGKFSIQDLLTSSSGLKSLAQLALGIATGGVASFPWSASLNIGFAALYTGAKAGGMKSLINKLRSRIPDKTKAQFAA